MSHVRENDFLSDVQDQRFDSVRKSLRVTFRRVLALVRARGEKKSDEAQRRCDEQHHDVLGRGHVDGERADVNRGPVRELQLARESGLEARILEMVRVRDVRSDDVLASEHMRSERIRAASMRIGTRRSL